MSTLIRGSLYVLISASLALLFGIIAVASFCHGDFAMLGGYVSYFLLANLGLDPIVTLILTGVIMFLLGMGIEKSLLYPLRLKSGKYWMFNTFVLTLGIAQIMENGALATVGSAFYGVRGLWPGELSLFGVATSVDRVAAIVIPLAIMAGVWAFLKYTRTGRAIRAVGMNEDAAALFGVNVNSIYTITFGLATALAGLAGIFYMALFTTYPYMGVTANLKAWIVVIVAGLGNIAGAVVVSFLIAFVEVLGYTFLSVGWPAVLAVIIVVIILILRPTGLFGTEVKGIWER